MIHRFFFCSFLISRFPLRGFSEFLVGIIRSLCFSVSLCSVDCHRLSIRSNHVRFSITPHHRSPKLHHWVCVGSHHVSIIHHMSAIRCSGHRLSIRSHHWSPISSEHKSIIHHRSSTRHHWSSIWSNHRSAVGRIVSRKGHSHFYARDGS